MRDRQMRHEIKRLTGMTDKQLTTRLGRITNPEKLKNFKEIAGMYGMRSLVREINKKIRVTC